MQFKKNQIWMEVLARLAFLCLLQIFSMMAAAQKTYQDSINNFRYAIDRLSPLPTRVENTATPTVSLNGLWEFAVNSKGNISSIEVPGEWEMQGYSVAEGEIAIYRRELKIPEAWLDKRIKVRFDGVSSHSTIKVNGKKILEHEGGFVPFEADITTALNRQENILQVEVRALTITDHLSALSQYAAHTVGGILRKVTLFVLPELNISNEKITTTFDKQYKNGELAITSKIHNESSHAKTAILRYRLINKEGTLVGDSSISIQASADSSTETSVSIPVSNPMKWNNENPYLYTLITALITDGKEIVQNRRKVGFRTVKVVGNELLVNGTPVKLHGVNMHDIHPVMGRSLTREMRIRDAVLFRNANCNYIRTSHYPPAEEFLNAADSLGLFIESESAISWVKHPEATPIWQKWNYLDLTYLPFMISANVEKITAQRNHPSVIIWSLANESYWSPLWAKVNQVVKLVDSTRPTTFHDQYRGDYNNGGSTADIAVFHYPNLKGPALTDTSTRPVLYGEYAHISNYNRRELATDPGIRVRYGLPLAQIYDSIYRHEGCLGGAIWSGLDDVFQMPDGRSVGYGEWGPVDVWRRTKPEYYGIKKAYSPVVVSNSNNPSISANKMTLQVENRYDFTNLNRVAINYSFDGKIWKTIAANIPARSKGIISIPVFTGITEVYITFTDPRGFISNEEKIILTRNAVEGYRRYSSVSISETKESVVVKQDNLVYLISKFNGLMTSIKKNNKEIIIKGPAFTVVAMNSDDGGKPSIASESYQKDIAPLKSYPLVALYADSFSIRLLKDTVIVAAKITFKEGKGMHSYIFSKNGTVTVKYQLLYTGRDSIPRQYGLVMQLPKTFDVLTWNRKGDFSTYPANDIGRTEGVARLCEKRFISVNENRKEPVGDWKDNSSELGSNDFRSTKANIYTAGLSDGTNKICMISDGTQSLRSWLQDEQIQLLVADYDNNGSEPVYATPHRSARINIRNRSINGSISFIIK